MSHAPAATVSTSSSLHSGKAAAWPLHPARAAFMILCLVLTSVRGLSMMSGEALAADKVAEPVHSAAQIYQMALEARTERNYPAMLTLLREAGEAGDLPAQEMLVSVLLSGPSLYGNSIAANPCEADHWARRAADQGSEVGRHQRALLNGLRELPQGRSSCAGS